MKKYKFIAVLVALIFSTFNSLAQDTNDNESWIEEPQDFRDTVIQDQYYFWGKKYKSPVNFTNTTFKTIDFQGVEFKSKSTFVNAKFNAYSKLDKVTFDSLDFNSARSDTLCFFNESKFNAFADFTS